MRRSTVLSRPLQLVFPGSGLTRQYHKLVLYSDELHILVSKRETYSMESLLKGKAQDSRTPHKSRLFCIKEKYGFRIKNQLIWAS